MDDALRSAAIATAVVILASCSGTRAEAVALDVDVRARALAPGEPVRVVVTSPESLESLEATFLDVPVAMFPVDSGGAAERWSGWAMIALDSDPGPATVEVRGTTAAGRPAAGSRALAVEPREFPTEELTVAKRYVTPPREVRERLERERARLAEIYARRTPVPLATEPFVRPVPGEPTSIFGTRRVFNGEPRSPHPGLDLRAAEGDPVVAAGPGRVVLADDLYYSGNVVIVDHGGGLFTLYAHLSRIDVDDGESVDRGRVVGRAGATGRVTGAHLHWGAKIGDRPFDPRALLDEALFR